MKFFIGLILGIAIAGGVAFYLNKAQNPFVDKGILNNTAAGPLTTGSPDASGSPLLLAPGTKMQAASAPAPKNNASTPTYDFYDVLQGKKSIASAPAAAATDAPSAHSKSYMIQAGAFSDPDLANNMKARLTLLGYNAKIESLREGDRIINKVILGPIEDYDMAAALVDELKQQDINATIVNQK